MSSDSPETRRGALIVIEGLDRAGKSSQCELLLRDLRDLGHQVKYIRFPGSLRSCQKSSLRRNLFS